MLKNKPSEKKGTEYERYNLTTKQKIIYFLEGEGIVLLISYLFYHRIAAVILLSPFIYFFIKEKKRTLKEERLNELNIQFKDGINSLSGALNAGYSIENAWKHALVEMKNIYGEDALITKEIQDMVRQMQMNVTIESLLNNFALRTGLEDIKSFAQVFGAAKRNGGDLIRIISSTAKTISDKIEIKREIYTIMSAKRFEQKIMNMVPFVIILYINISSPGFLNILYSSIMGAIVMTVCLLIYFASYYISQKIIDIEV